jgi:hypothetical protein
MPNDKDVDMKDKTKNPENVASSKNAKQNASQKPSSKGPAKEYETHKSPEKPGDNKSKRLGESETEIDDETTI